LIFEPPEKVKTHKLLLTCYMTYSLMKSTVQRVFLN